MVVSKPPYVGLHKSGLWGLKVGFGVSGVGKGFPRLGFQVCVSELQSFGL